MSLTSINFFCKHFIPYPHYCHCTLLLHCTATSSFSITLPHHSHFPPHYHIIFLSQNRHHHRHHYPTSISMTPPQAFTSHLGSREHKMQKERLDKDPGYREDFMARVAQKQQQQLMQQQQQTAVRNVPGKKQFHCRLCSTNINGAELYAVHLKSFEHQQVPIITTSKHNG